MYVFLGNERGNEACPKDGAARERIYRQPLIHSFETNEFFLLPSWLGGKCQILAGMTESIFCRPKKLSACLNTASKSWIRQLGSALYIYCAEDSRRRLSLAYSFCKSKEYDDALSRIF